MKEKKERKSTERVLPESSRETKFSDVHKDSWAARGLGGRALAIPSRTVLKKAGGKAEQSALASSCASAREKNKNDTTMMSNEKCWYRLKNSVVSRVVCILNIFRTRNHALAGLY